MKILVVTGSSGGHVFPALSFLERIRETHKEAKVLLVMPRQSVLQKLLSPHQDIAFISISSIGLSVNKRNLLGCLRFLRGCVESAWIVAKFNPDIIVGFGSIASIPMVLCARIRGAKILIHEQNVIPGRANRMLLKVADKVALSFKESSAYLRGYERKTVFTGNPVRRSLERCQKVKALDYFGFKSDLRTVLVTGGSQGSQAVNSAFTSALGDLSLKESVQVIHLCGAKDYGHLENFYKMSKIRFRLFAFFDAMQYAYSAADLIISRAGATTIAELKFFSLPAILIPYPHAYQHQNENAKVLEGVGAALILREDQLGSGVLRDSLKRLLFDESKLKTMRDGYQRLAVGSASDELVRLAVSLLR